MLETAQHNQSMNFVARSVLSRRQKKISRGATKREAVVQQSFERIYVTGRRRTRRRLFELFHPFRANSARRLAGGPLSIYRFRLRHLSMQYRALTEQSQVPSSFIWQFSAFEQQLSRHSLLFDLVIGHLLAAYRYLYVNHVLH